MPVCVKVHALHVSEVCSCDWKRECVCACADKCVWSMLPISGALHSSCVLTLCLGGEWKGGWAEERRGRERVQQSEREKVRATHQIEGETRRVDGEDRWTSARVSQQQQKQESTLFFPSSQGICLFLCLPWEFCQWASGREERKRVEERSAAERDDVPPPSLNAEVKWGLPWREVEKKDEKLIAVSGYKHISFQRTNGRAKLWEVNHWWRAPWRKMLHCRSATYPSIPQKTFGGHHERFWHLLLASRISSHLYPLPRLGICVKWTPDDSDSNHIAPSSCRHL